MSGAPLLHVCFVCSFNRARSVIAEVIFSEQLHKRGLGDVVRVSSAGTVAIDGAPIDHRTAAVLVKHGYPASAMHCARRVNDDHLSADLVVTFGYEQARILQQRGVGNERIRCAPVRNPSSSNAFESALTAIECALPSVHSWVAASRAVSASAEPRCGRVM